MSEHTFDIRESGSRADVASKGSAMGMVTALTGVLDDQRLVRLEAIAELDRSRDFEYDGYTSTSAFLIHRCGMSTRDANREVFSARSLAQMPQARRSVMSGDLTMSQLEVLAFARNRHPGPFAENEAYLSEAVRGLTLADTRRAVNYWCQLHDHAEGSASEEDQEPSRVFFSKTWRGRWRLDGELDPETGDQLNTALDELMSQIVDATPKEELESPSVRRGEAMAELAGRFLDSPDAPTDHGNRPHVTVVVGWDTLAAHRPGPSELLDGTVISPADARRLACDAEVCRLLTGPRGEILDMGRRVRTVTASQWQALRIRDRHCQFRGCYRPWSWCDAHHIVPWTEDEGPTDLVNLILLCRHHHTLIHRTGWQLTGIPGDITITRPDGTALANGPP